MGKWIYTDILRGAIFAFLHFDFSFYFSIVTLFSGTRIFLDVLSSSRQSEFFQWIERSSRCGVVAIENIWSWLFPLGHVYAPILSGCILIMITGTYVFDLCGWSSRRSQQSVDFGQLVAQNVWLFVLFVRMTMKLVSKRARPIDWGARDGGSGPVRHAVCWLTPSSQSHRFFDSMLEERMNNPYTIKLQA